MKKREVVKTIISTVASIGIGVIVENAIKVNTPSTIGKITKVFVVVGGIALTGMLSAMADKYIGEQIDEGMNTIDTWTKGTPPEEPVEE